MKIETLHQHFLNSSGICTDTRNIKENCLYFALKGDNFNGNQFAQEALDKGALKVIIDEIGSHKNTGETILCANSLKLLQELATYHREYLKVPIISLTGSNGKTTTKELISSVLSKKYQTVATKGNLNNHIGVPLTLLSMDSQTEIGVVEMGANHIKEIEALCKIAKPNYGYITNFGKAHLEGFGSIEGVIQGKSELYQFLIKNKEAIFLNADDPIQKKLLLNYAKKYGFSESDPKYFKISYKTANPFVVLEVDNTVITSNLIGKYNFTNIAAAIIIGHFFNVPIAHIKDAIETYIPTNNRSQLIEKAGHKIILDAYNANPSSMMAALEHFEKNAGDNKVVFLGDMFELGNDAAQEHQKILDWLKEHSFTQCYLIGQNFYRTKTETPYLHFFKTFDDLKAHLGTVSLTQSDILIKASRGMALERILDLLK